MRQGIGAPALPSGSRPSDQAALRPDASRFDPSRGPCAKLTTTATIVALDGQRFVGTNDCANPQTVCPRAGMATGVGYELCTSICQQTAHAEVNACRAAGHEARGGTLYLEGHYYACDHCKRVCDEHGIVAIVIGGPPA